MVICDSSTLIHLSGIGRIHLLKDLFERVTIPPAVWREVVEQGAGRPGVPEVEEARRAGWLAVQAPSDLPLLRHLRHELDAGEAEVVALAVERGASLVLLDESEARRLASTFGLEKTGIIGILIRARMAGRIERLAPELVRLRTDSGFWIDERLFQRALQVVGEAP